MENYIFSSHWIPIGTETPTNGTRCLVSDGEHISIATYIEDGTSVHWMFSETPAGNWSMRVKGWMPIPKPMKIPIPFGESI